MSAISPRGIVVFAAILTATLSTPAPCQATKADEAAIRAARDRSNRAIAAHDVDGTTRVFLPEYVSVSSGNGRTVGRDAGRANYTQIFANRPGVVFVRTPRTITVNATWGQAGESGHWTGRWSSPDGLIRVGGEYFAKWKTLGGHWRLLTETFVQTTCSGGHYCDAPPVAADQPPALGLSHVFVAVDSATLAGCGLARASGTTTTIDAGASLAASTAEGRSRRRTLSSRLSRWTSAGSVGSRVGRGDAPPPSWPNNRDPEAGSSSAHRPWRDRRPRDRTASTVSTSAPTIRAHPGPPERLPQESPRRHAILILPRFAPLGIA